MSPGRKPVFIYAATYSNPTDGEADYDGLLDLHAAKLVGTYEVEDETSHQVHTIETLEGAVVVEVSTPELHDVIRIADGYGRADA